MEISKKHSEFLTLDEMLVAFVKRPKVNYLWGGIKEKSFGLVFGPSKGGKTIFCEAMAMKIATGAKSFFGLKLNGKPKKVLFIGLEEYWANRVERNLLQMNEFSEAEKVVLKENYLYQPIEFSKTIVTEKNWKSLISTIKASKAEVVIIDSVTRMNHGNLEDSKTAEEIMQRLREICYDESITLICIHHTPKMNNDPITIDKIKGSSVFAQEADFAIGINRTAMGIRYQKHIFYRYASDDYEKVSEFKINENSYVVQVGEEYETAILQRSDRRRDDEKRELIVSAIDNFHCKKIKTSDLVPILKKILGIEERQIKGLLTELVEEKKINSPKRGYYCSVNCNDQKGESDEKK